jgi:hypothetical protein
MLATAPELLLIGFVIGVVGGGMMLYAITRPASGKKGITWANTGSARTLPDE